VATIDMRLKKDTRRRPTRDELGILLAYEHTRAIILGNIVRAQSPLVEHYRAANEALQATEAHPYGRTEEKHTGWVREQRAAGRDREAVFSEWKKTHKSMLTPERARDLFRKMWPKREN